MVLDKVAGELRSALEVMKAEHEKLSRQINSVESILADLGAPVKRGPGRPKGSGTKKRGPGRPKGSGKKVTAKKRGPGRPKGSGKKTAAKAAAPAAPSAAGTAGAAGAATSKQRRASPKWTPEAREAARQRMKTYWADRKKKPRTKSRASKGG